MTQPEWSPSPESVVPPPPAGAYGQSAGYPPSSGYPAQLDSAGEPVLPTQRQPAAANAGGRTPVRKKKATGKIVLAGLLARVLGLLIGSTSAKNSPTTTSAAAPTTNSAGAALPPGQVQSAPTPAEVPAAAPPISGRLTTLGPGTHEVGTGHGQALPGRYTATGPDGSSAGCYDSRLKNNDDSIGDILSNHLSPGPSVFTLQPTDGYIQISVGAPSLNHSPTCWAAVEP
jgi:hypothetical protein